MPDPQPTGLKLTLLIGVGLVVLTLAGVLGASVLFSDRSAGADPQTAGPGLEPLVAASHQAPLPTTELDGFGGAGPVQPGEYQGAPLIVNFWATWCEPCKEEMPHFEAFAAEHGEQIPVLGVDVQDAPSNAEEFIEELQITYDLAVDHDGSYFRETQSVHMPTTLFVDADGTIVYRQAGYMDHDELVGLASEHLDLDD